MKMDFGKFCNLQFKLCNLKFRRIFPSLIIFLLSLSIAFSQPTTWSLVYHETFDTPFAEPAVWTEDTYGDAAVSHTPPFDDDGDYFVGKGGATFANNLQSYRAFRKSYPYGANGWLTAELYGRDSDKDGVPETGGNFASVNGKAKLTSTRHYDGTLLRSTNPLPSKYRIEVTLSNINFGGKINGSWTYNNKYNGYDAGETADPWKWGYSPDDFYDATTQNGMYFLAIVDFPNPSPRNNTFWHHHRKLFMDTDNNIEGGRSWSKIWDPVQNRAVTDGSHLVSMIWLNGETWGSDETGNSFMSYTTGGWKTDATLVDKYLDGESYTFAIERDGRNYTMSATGKFYYGGQKTYTATRSFREYPVTWHYNQNSGEYQPPSYNEYKTYNGVTYPTWPGDSFYPDYFIIGDPHTNFYEGTVEIDDLKLYIDPTNSVDQRFASATSGRESSQTQLMRRGLQQNAEGRLSIVFMKGTNDQFKAFDIHGKLLPQNSGTIQKPVFLK